MKPQSTIQKLEELSANEKIGLHSTIQAVMESWHQRTNFENNISWQQDHT